VNRVRWFRAQLPHSLRSVAAKISSAPLKLDGDMGFRIEKARNDAIEAIYHERFTWTERNVDPFGREFAFERTEYKSVRFALSRNYPELELIDAPRGLTSFFSRLAEMTDFEAAIEPLTVDVLDWAAAIRQSRATEFRVAGITVSNLNVEEGIIGRLTVMSREKDVQAALSKLLARRAYSLQKLQIEFRDEYASGSLVLAADGSVRSDKELDLDVLKEIRDALPKPGRG
jgi:hypothetical protein